MSIKLSKLGEDYLKKFKNNVADFKLAKLMPYVYKGRTVIHLYPEKDTFTPSGKLVGFIDALFFTAIIYNYDKKEKYVLPLRDDISLESIMSCSPAHVRIFKDGSTVLFFNGLCKIGSGQSISIDLV